MTLIVENKSRFFCKSRMIPIGGLFKGGAYFTKNILGRSFLEDEGFIEDLRYINLNKAVHTYSDVSNR